MRLIPDSGPPTARIAVVGEMDAQHEESQRQHLVGPSGQALNRTLREAGIERAAVYVTNVVCYRHNAKNAINLVPRAELAEHVATLHERLARLEAPVVLVPLGNTALHALTGLSGITKHRGSIYEYASPHGRRTKVIPTVHPASLFRQPSWQRRFDLDWRRIAADAGFRDLRLPEREHFIEPRWRDLEDFVADAEARAEVLSIDIETPRKITLTEVPDKRGKIRIKRVKGDPRVTVVGFSFDPAFSFTVPTTTEYWEPQGVDLKDVWTLLRRLCALPNVAKGGQNFGFDAWWLLREHDCPVTEYRYDTRWMSHCADVLDEHSLGYQASIYLRAQFWKDDSKDDDKDSDTFISSGMDALRTYWRYNGKDAAHTRELMDIHDARLGAAGRLTHYFRRYVPLFEPMLAMSVGGLRTDVRAAKRQAARFQAETLDIQAQLDGIAGVPLYGPKGSLSTKKLGEFLYDTLRLPVQRDRATGNRATNEIVVRRLLLKHPAKLADAGPLILRHRRLEALKRFVREGIVDPDGITRTQYGFTYTMRFTSGKAPNRRGANLQNTDRELLAMYVPDPGHVFIEVDLSQGEDRIVKTLAAALPSTSAPRADELLWRAQAQPWENDEHWRAAESIFAPRTRAEMKKEVERYIGKRSRHAGNYGMRGKTMSEQLSKEGYTYTPEDCDGFIDLVIDRDTPEIRSWQRATRQTILRDRRLTNSWGHLVDFRFERLGDDLYREAYAVIPQSELTSIIKYWGLLPLHRKITDEALDARVVLEKHDSLLISTAPVHAWEIACFLKASLERPRTYSGHELTIPIEVKLGANAAMSTEFKMMPSREEFEDAIRPLLR